MHYKFGGLRDKHFTERFIFTSHTVIFTCTVVLSFFLRRNLICFHKQPSEESNLVLLVLTKRKIMDGQREMTSSFSFTADLFGTKESPSSSSTGIFASILSPPSTVVGRNSSNSEVGTWQKQPPGNQAWNNKPGTPAPHAESTSGNKTNRHRNSIFQEERAEPCHLSSSLYYGGQDIYSRSPDTKASASYPIVRIDGGEDDPNGNNSHGASRGNWWQGSLYY